MKKTLYLNANGANQLRKFHKLSTKILKEDYFLDQFKVTVEVASQDGSTTENIGVVSIKGFQGDLLSNAMMKCVTKATRRAVLAHIGISSSL